MVLPIDCGQDKFRQGYVWYLAFVGQLFYPKKLTVYFSRLEDLPGQGHAVDQLNVLNGGTSAHLQEPGPRGVQVRVGDPVSNDVD